MNRPPAITRTAPFAAALTLTLALAVAAGCKPGGGAAGEATSEPLYPREPASQAFWDAWSHGQAEVASYALVTPRYGAPRDGVAVLVYVLEEHDRRTWIKNDRGDVPEGERAVVMKLNHMTRFQTGVYPYSVMTSVFAPVGGIGRERFAPTRIVLTAQEWCGQVYHRVMPGVRGFESEIRSYFSTEGEATTAVSTPPYPLYEDALLIQLRELDGPFMGGGDWSGPIVPSLWARRISHEPLGARAGTITRSETVRDDGTPVNRFVLRYATSDGPPYERTYDVEIAPPHRVMGWSTSAGERAELVADDRLKYWELNAPGDERYRERIGLDPDLPRLRR